MDAHLTTLQATLSSIAALQRPLFTRPTPQPFTTSFLDLPSSSARRDFIRESDAIERRLFHFPPIGGSGLDDGKDEHAEDPRSNAESSPPQHVDAISDEVFLRKPQVRSVAVPTPLRPTTTADKAHRGGSTAVAPTTAQYDARSLLIAAQRLNDNYSHGPRARKHIKSLLKQAKDSMTQKESHTRKIQRLERVLELLASGRSVDEIGEEEDLGGLLGVESAVVALPVASSSSTSSSSSATRLRELKRRTDEIKVQLNREEMEVLALEEMREEVMVKRKELQEKKRQQQQQQRKAAPPARPVQPKSRPSLSPAAVAQTPPTTSTSPSASRTPSTRSAQQSHPPLSKPPPPPKAAAARARLSRLAPRVSTAVGTTGSKPPRVATRPSQVAPIAESTSASRDADDADDIAPAPAPEPTHASSSSTTSEGDATIRAVASSPPPAAPSSSAAVTSTTEDPEPTDELERLSEKIWDAFGDHLRHFHPTLESADFLTTLALLRQCIATLDGGQASTISSGASATSSSSASTSVATLPSVPPTRQSAISSLVLVQLLTSPPPDHSVEFGELKQRGKEWLDTRNKSVVSVDDDTDADADGEQLTTKAVYALVAKRLLRIRRTGGKARVGFGS